MWALLSRITGLLPPTSMSLGLSVFTSVRVITDVVTKYEKRDRLGCEIPHMALQHSKGSTSHLLVHLLLLLQLVPEH